MRTFQIILLFTMCLTLIGCENSVQQNNAVIGNKLYIPEGYDTQLSSLKLTEVAQLPYFTKPFISVAKDEDGQQFAVLFHSSDKVDSVKLPVSYEETIKRIELKGFKIKVGTASVQNLHMFEINNNLFWNSEDGTGKVYLTLKGEVVSDPFKRAQ